LQIWVGVEHAVPRSGRGLGQAAVAGWQLQVGPKVPPSSEILTGPELPQTHVPSGYAQLTPAIAQLAESVILSYVAGQVLMVHVPDAA
jgi:hypothetical protein